MLKVFLADDSQIVRDRLKEVFAEKGFIDVVGTAGDADEALQAIRRLTPDVAILDIRMPGGGGLAVLTDIKARLPSLVVIILTAYPYPQYRQVFLNAGADYFFDKTKDIQRLSDVLAELAQQQTGATKKKILVLGDDPAIITAVKIAIGQGRELVTLVSNLPCSSNSRLLTDLYDLIVLVLCSIHDETVIARARALLTSQVGKVPLLIISPQPVQADGDPKIYHLDYPFAVHDLNARVREILKEDLAPALVFAPVQNPLTHTLDEQ